MTDADEGVQFYVALGNPEHNSDFPNFHLRLTLVRCRVRWSVRALCLRVKHLSSYYMLSDSATLVAVPLTNPLEKAMS